MDSDRDLKDLIKEAADMEDAKYEEPFSLNFEDQEQSNNYQITNRDQEAQEGPVLSQNRQGKSRETPAEQAVITRSSTVKRRSTSTGQAGKSKTTRKKAKVDYAQGHGECEVVPVDNQKGPDFSASLKSIEGSILALSNVLAKSIGAGIGLTGQMSQPQVQTLPTVSDNLPRSQPGLCSKPNEISTSSVSWSLDNQAFPYRSSSSLREAGDSVPQKRSNEFSSVLEDNGHFLSSPPVAASSLPADSEASENIDFDTMMQNVFKTPPVESSNPPDEFLSSIMDEYGDEDNTDKPVSSQIAKLVDKMLVSKMTKDKVREKTSAQKRPQNCELLTITRVNPEIWGKMKPATKAFDIKLQRIQNCTVKGISSLVKALDLLIKTKNQAKNQQEPSIQVLGELSRMIGDSLPLLCLGNYQLNLRRRELIKPDLNKQFEALTSTAPVSKLLFGDSLADQVKEIVNTNRLAGRVAHTQRQNVNPVQSYLLRAQQPSYRGRSRINHSGSFQRHQGSKNWRANRNPNPRY